MIDRLNWAVLVGISLWALSMAQTAATDDSQVPQRQPAAQAYPVTDASGWLEEPSLLKDLQSVRNSEHVPWSLWSPEDSTRMWQSEFDRSFLKRVLNQR